MQGIEELAREQRSDFVRSDIDDCLPVPALVEMWQDILKRPLGNRSKSSENKSPYTEIDRLKWIETGISTGVRDNAMYHFINLFRHKGVEVNRAPAVLENLQRHIRVLVLAKELVRQPI